MSNSSEERWALYLKSAQNSSPSPSPLYANIDVNLDGQLGESSLGIGISPVGLTPKEFRRVQRLQERMERDVYFEGRAAIAESQNRELAEKMERLESLLVSRLREPLTDHLRGRISQEIEASPAPVVKQKRPPEPSSSDFIEPPPNLILLSLPWIRNSYERRFAESDKRYSEAISDWHAELQRITERENDGEMAALKRRDALIVRRKAARSRAVEKLNAAMAGDATSVNHLISKLLSQDRLPSGFPRSHRVSYSADSRMIAVERQLPVQSVIPDIRAYRYTKSSNSYSALPRPAAAIRAVYKSLVAQFALRTLLVIALDPLASVIDTIALNCYVDAIDPATGNQRRSVLISLTVAVQEFRTLGLAQADPIACIRGLRAIVSANPSELQGVRPVFDFDMADPRFIGKTDILTGLDSRPNLAELSPNEFEQLMTNLLDKMGLETRLTQASRDGGVDCVAWDMRPVIGGKVIVQAKRYKNTVGVSAVRDLYGTLLNEGGAKGLLVTTSGFGTASFEFAKNKPLELIDGSNLIYLLKEHAGLDVRISFPESWEDPVA